MSDLPLHNPDPHNPQALLDALLRQDLNAFIEKTFRTVSPGDGYLPNWHIEAIAYELMQTLAFARQAAPEDEDNPLAFIASDPAGGRLLITQPPRSLKSIASSVAFVAWALGHDPSLEFLCVSYSNELALDLARQFRLVVDSEWYQRLFPQMRVTKATAGEIRTSRGGGRLSTSIGGTLTGRGGNIVIIDDPLKAEEAQSATARKHVVDWYSTTLASRLNDKRRGAIIVVMQRLHEEDLAGYLLDHGAWRHLDLPAIATEDQNVRLGPDKVYQRPKGEVLHAAREPLDALERLKQELGSLTFSAQYQQRPLPVEGNLVKREWLPFYDAVPESPGKPQIIQSWDVAGSITNTADYSVCTTWLNIKKEHYLIHVWRGQVAFPDLKRKVIALQAEFDAQTVLIEKDGLGLSLYDDLRQNSPRGFPAPIGIKAEGNKLARLEGQTAKIEAGTVYLPKEAPWLDTYLHELLAFPNTRNDDQVDSTSQYLNWAAKHQKSSGGPYGPILFMEDEFGQEYVIGDSRLTEHFDCPTAEDLGYHHSYGGGDILKEHGYGIGDDDDY